MPHILPPPEDHHAPDAFAEHHPLVNRFADPDDLIDTSARDLRLRDLQLTHEFINPSGTPNDPTLTPDGQGLQRTGVRITSGMTGPTPAQPFRASGCRCSALLYDWFKTFADIIGELGGTSVGTQFAIFTYKDYDDPVRREDLIRIAIDCWRTCPNMRRGRPFLCFLGPMSIGREFGETIAECMSLQTG